jgi:hypothetical protein
VQASRACPTIEIPGSASVPYYAAWFFAAWRQDDFSQALANSYFPMLRFCASIPILHAFGHGSHENHATKAFSIHTILHRILSCNRIPAQVI